VDDVHGNLVGDAAQAADRRDSMGRAAEPRVRHPPSQRHGRRDGVPLSKLAPHDPSRRAGIVNDSGRRRRTLHTHWRTSMGRNAVITGASGGIGRAVAERLAHDGFSVVLNYAGNAAQADEAVAAINAAGGRAVALKADVASATEVEQLFTQAGGLGPID